MGLILEVKNLTKKFGGLTAVNDANFEIDKAIRQLAYVNMMKEMGWSEHDISDNIPKSGEYHRNFIGTEEEYNNLIAKIKD